MITLGLFFFSSCSNHSLSEQRLADEKVIEMSNAVLTAMRTSFNEAISKMKPGEKYYNGLDFTLVTDNNNFYRMNFDHCVIIVEGKPVILKDGEAEFLLQDIPSFTGAFEIGKLEFIYERLERDFEWNFTYDGAKYDGEIEIEDNKYFCMDKLFQIRSEKVKNTSI